LLKSSAPSAPGLLAVGSVQNPTYLALIDATLVPFPPTITAPFTTNGLGSFSLDVAGGSGPVTLYAQAIVIAPLEPTGIAVSNALEIELEP
jgi:hypothetical protein